MIINLFGDFVKYDEIFITFASAHSHFRFRTVHLRFYKSHPSGYFSINVTTIHLQLLSMFFSLQNAITSFDVLVKKLKKMRIFYNVFQIRWHFRMSLYVQRQMWPLFIKNTLFFIRKQKEKKKVYKFRFSIFFTFRYTRCVLQKLTNINEIFTDCINTKCIYYFCSKSTKIFDFLFLDIWILFSDEKETFA